LPQFCRDLPLQSPQYPVTFHAPVREGVNYGANEMLSMQLANWQWRGTMWRYHRHIRTYRPSTQVFYKNVRGLNPDTEQDFWNVIHSCQRAGLRMPSSFSGIFHQVFESPWPDISSTALFQNQTVGAWQQAFIEGSCKGKLYKYDLNSAYQWAASQPLPDIRSWYPVRSIDDSWSLCFGQVEKLPFYVSTNDPQLWTREEIESQKLKIANFVIGIGFDKWVDLRPVFAVIREWFPFCYKRIGRAFWGRWNTAQSIEQVSWINGRERRLTLQNRLFNPYWSRYITSRVKTRLADIIVQAGAVQVYVDSVICYEELPTGEAVGDWKLVDTFSDLYFYGAGVYTEKDRIIKRSGMSQEQGARLCRINSTLGK